MRFRWVVVGLPAERGDSVRIKEDDGQERRTFLKKKKEKRRRYFWLRKRLKRDGNLRNKLNVSGLKT